MSESQLQFKRYISISLLILLLFNSTGYYILFELNKREVEHQKHLYFQKNPAKISTIAIMDNEKVGTAKLVGKNEIVLAGKMYDIVKSVRKIGYTLYYCIQDKKEDHLLGAISKHQNGSKSLGLLLQFSIFENPNHNLPNHLYANSMVLFADFNSQLVYQPLQTFTPPPEGI